MVLSQCGLKVLVAGGASDSHTWNLAFLQLLVEEMGHHVVNLGPCVPEDLLAAECRAQAPDLVVLSSVNGHGYGDGLRAVERLRREPGQSAVPVVIGGKLGVAGGQDESAARRLLDAGADAVFDDGDLNAFQTFVTKLASTAAVAVRSERAAT